MFQESYKQPLAELQEGTITHTEFLKKVKCISQYRKWCKDNNIIPNEENAELFFDMHGFAESEEVKEYIEPVY